MNMKIERRVFIDNITKSVNDIDSFQIDYGIEHENGNLGGFIERSEFKQMLPNIEENLLKKLITDLTNN